MYSNRKLKKAKVWVNKVKRLPFSQKKKKKKSKTVATTSRTAREKKVVLDFLAQEESNLPFGIDSPVKSPCTTTNRQRQDHACP